ncbi:plasmid pRiA4b ORF-3 family protein [Microbacterium aurantiacum]|uniref:Plasmid pRiA4b ORF-3 family protein n=1 Tax=Microbacterium aurantiacum TaxID=162393 RepID=A0ABT8FPE8_9MICO|nr:plasmid pRiA4b ORF-3 family protein [Microbacterium aurantiacum]MDN4463203.1 plasmid pRiA4b ORF-3 family protein [Microbacterium aurantiacum]
MDEEEITRRFRELTAGMSAADLLDLAGALASSRVDATVNPPRPELRYPRRGDVAVFRVRVDIEGEKPPIWRRLDIRSAITLDTLHDVLQAAFGWTDSHLHRFALGGGVWDRDSQLFLCAYDIDDPDADDDGVPESEVRLDEVMAEPGDILRYVYDYGDAWQVTLRLENVVSADAEGAGTPPPIAHCLDGRRAAPPEDSRGADAATLAALQPDPARFDPAEVNELLGDVRFRLREAGVASETIATIDRLRFAAGFTPEGDIAPTDPLIEAAATALATPEPAVDSAEQEACLRAWTWFLHRAEGGGIPLTAAGYLKPADVADISQILPTSDAWLTKSTREIDHSFLLHFREALVRQGLLRKYKGRLLLTRIGASARRSPDRLWQALVDRWRGVVAGTRLVDGRAGSSDAAYTRAATVCVLLAVAAGETFSASWGDHRPGGLDHAARWLTLMGWRMEGDDLRGRDLYALPIRTVLENLWDGVRGRSDKGEMSGTARRFAREVLRGV